ncbi:type I methionyl aminopeptidase [Candidatus Microgenomates bacterium]|nr:type I methionyl aminopeptidase [Candidatus Microgenomates bacterium]
MIHLKSPQEIKIMKESGQILSAVLRDVLSKAAVGVTLLDLDLGAEKEIIKRGGEPSFKKVKGYHWTLCTCLNEAVVHGIPNDYVIRDGDVVGIDCGVYYKGYHSDAAWTVKIGQNGNGEVDRFLKTGQRALEQAISKVKIGNYIWDISKEIEDVVEGAGYSVVQTLVGHGVGKKLHEDPAVPGFVGQKREKTPKICEGMVLAVEVIYNMGSPEVIYRGNDGWTIVTKDGKISGLFEATVAATIHGGLVLTPSPV